MEVDLTLKQMILHEINTRSKVFVSELVKVSGYSNLQNFKRCLTSDREFDKFQGLIDVLDFIWGEKVVELMAHYSTTIDPNKKSARNMLEYLSVSRQLKAFKSLLERMSECCNKESREWSRAYFVQFEAQRDYPNINYDLVIQKAKKFKTNINELKVFMKIVKTHAYHQKGDYFMTRVLAEEIETYLNEMDNDYTVNSYEVKLCEIMTWIELRVFNRPEECRRYADKLINGSASKHFKAFANFQKGYSYFFTTYEECIKYFNESLRIYKEIHSNEWVIKDIEEKIEFAQVFWGKKLECYEVKNYFLMNVKNGVNVRKLLDEHKDKLDEPMYLYLKGYNDKNPTLLIESVLLFVKKGDSHLANLPRSALIEMEYEDIHLVDIAMNIREP